MEGLTTAIKVEVESDKIGLQLFNEITQVVISIRNKRIIVKYDKVYELNGNEMFREEDSYSVIHNEEADPAEDEYLLWLNGQVGIDIAAAVVAKLQVLNGTPA